MMPDSNPSKSVKHHLVSMGLQKNFATVDKKLTILSAADGRVVEYQRPTKRNWVVSHFNSIKTLESFDPSFENEWSRLEATSLRRIREIQIGNCEPVHLRAVATVFAIHIVRSEAFEVCRNTVYHCNSENLVDVVANDTRLRDRFIAVCGRPPGQQELESRVRDYATQLEDSRRGFVGSMINAYNTIVEMLSKYRIQIVQSIPTLPGFVLGDVPVVHANLEQGRFGFRDNLAVGDSDIIIGALTRTTVACFTVKKEESRRVGTASKVQQINNLFVRAALREVACHPNDTLAVKRLCVNKLPLKRP